IIASGERVLHLPETLSHVAEKPRESGEAQFDYVDPRNRAVQIEMELAFTAYLRMVGAFLTPRTELVDIDAGDFANEASVIIPVRNRVRTIADAVSSALEQKLDKPFNVIVVDNHSTDGTSEVLARLAAENPRLTVIVPERDDLGIGGCWNRAIEHPECGRYSVQLDSDDRYKTDQTLQKIVDCFRRERVAMVVGSYELTDFDGNPIPPGVIDHSEWTQNNGHNNALRINGFGAPRAFFTPVLREVGVPNVSYGEDYGVGIRVTRLYKMARIFESLYLCRRWEGNTDHRLSPRTIVEHNHYKDWLRTIALMARKKMNRS
ncbi:MAG: glycosyltransferase family 2 protein, partial [Muribaculaceae bacterium]|nr:glycosyltransferase family 2 protein [Muribaculaceae bacterium]